MSPELAPEQGVGVAESELLDATIAGLRSRSVDPASVTSALGVRRSASPSTATDALAAASLLAVRRQHSTIAADLRNVTAEQDVDVAQAVSPVPARSTSADDAMWALAQYFPGSDEHREDIAWLFATRHVRLPRSAVAPFVSAMYKAEWAAYPLDVTFDGAEDVARQAAKANPRTAQHFGPSEQVIHALRTSPLATTNYPRSSALTPLTQWWLTFFARDEATALECTMALLAAPRAASTLRGAAVAAAAHIHSVAPVVLEAAARCNDKSVRQQRYIADVLRGSDYGLGAIDRVVTNSGGTLQWRKTVNATPEDTERLSTTRTQHVRQLISWADWLTAFTPDELVPLRGRLGAHNAAFVPWWHTLDAISAADGTGRKMPAPFSDCIRRDDVQTVDDLDRQAAVALLRKEAYYDLHEHLTRSSWWSPSLTRWVLDERDVLLGMPLHYKTSKKPMPNEIGEYLMRYGDALTLEARLEDVQDVASRCGEVVPTTRIQLARLAQHFPLRESFIPFTNTGIL